jgi:hypothetical protein
MVAGRTFGKDNAATPTATPVHRAVQAEPAGGADGHLILFQLPEKSDDPGGGKERF